MACALLRMHSELFWMIGGLDGVLPYDAGHMLEVLLEVDGGLRSGEFGAGGGDGERGLAGEFGMRVCALREVLVVLELELVVNLLQTVVDVAVLLVVVLLQVVAGLRHDGVAADGDGGWRAALLDARAPSAGAACARDRVTSPVGRQLLAADDFSASLCTCAQRAYGRRLSGGDGWLVGTAGCRVRPVGRAGWR